MPAVLHPQSDVKLIPQLEKAPKVLTFDPDGKYRLFTLNFYFNDQLRAIRSISEAETSPRGTVVISPADVDTTGWSRNFYVETLTERGCDFRKPLLKATRK